MSNWLIIGSIAQYHWFPDSRKPSDIDLLTPSKVTGNESAICVVDCQWHDLAQEIIDINIDPVFMDPNMLLTLKVSHAHWDIKWDKTMHDIKFLMDHGCVVNQEIYKKLIPIWEKIHGKKKVNLKQSVSEFFTDNVKRKYDHEFLHELVAYNDRPLHESIRDDKSSVWCSFDKFTKFSSEQRNQIVEEEMMVTAIERFNLSFSSKNSERIIACNKSYKLLVTSMTKGWFAEFMIMNKFHILANRRTIWLDQLNNALLKLNTAL